MLTEAIKEFYQKKEQDPSQTNERSVKLITWQGGYDLFCEAMKKEGEKILRNSKINLETPDK
jgi:hypothetical protein